MMMVRDRIRIRELIKLCYSYLVGIEEFLILTNELERRYKRIKMHFSVIHFHLRIS
jgi:hypothetical protein